MSAPGEERRLTGSLRNWKARLVESVRLHSPAEAAKLAQPSDELLGKIKDCYQNARSASAKWLAMMCPKTLDDGRWRLEIFDGPAPQLSLNRQSAEVRAGTEYSRTWLRHRIELLPGRYKLSLVARKLSKSLGGDSICRLTLLVGDKSRRLARGVDTIPKTLTLDFNVSPANPTYAMKPISLEVVIECELQAAGIQINLESVVVEPSPPLH